MSSPVFSSKNSKNYKTVFVLVIVALLGLVVYNMIYKNEQNEYAYQDSSSNVYGLPNSTNYPTDPLKGRDRVAIDQPWRKNYPQRNIRRTIKKNYFEEEPESNLSY